MSECKKQDDRIDKADIKEMIETIEKAYSQKRLSYEQALECYRKMTFIGEKIKPSEFSEHCLPLICKAMDCGVSKIQGVVVDNLSYVSNNIDADIFSAKIYPRSIQILLHTNSDKLKKRLLCSIKNLYNLLDSNMINNVLINDLEKLRSKDKSLCVCDGIEMIFEEIVDSVSVDTIRKKIVPTLISILVEGNINEKSM